ncbi:MAG: tRNA (guanine(10)-N(2))-dimethyltransferase [Candidatus Nitrosocaldus sp.]|nr:tRNA (guanine(10)-N(2))-dimethyltransferase [Candidatus Nitrosocaldus sp.]MDW7999695.1 tRNA (guanine(10)-N(2))-dimethyltransferase [Candidatus Nitrosocaldus sp.]
MAEGLREIVEGRSRLLVPEASLVSDVPPKQPAFYNPAARVSRDVSVLAYNAYITTQDMRERSFADALAGIGARALRVAVEVKGMDEVYINDVNPIAVEIAREASILNGVERLCRFSVDTAYRFLMEHSSRGSRFGMVDIDPFGTPAPYVDCALRAIVDGGMLSMTATDTPILYGIYPRIALRRYHGRSMRCEYANEVGLRLLLGMLSMVASRLEMGVEPLFVQSTRHYMRVYARVRVGPRYADEMPTRLGYVYHCSACANRFTAGMDEQQVVECSICNGRLGRAGPLWIDRMMDAGFVDLMNRVIGDDAYSLSLDKRALDIVRMAKEESREEDALYYTVDEITSMLRVRPPTTASILDALRGSGFRACRTCLSPRGFRTDASIDEICRIVRALVDGC